MAKLMWNAMGSRYYEAGVDRGVLYLDSGPGIAWNGLTGVSETSSGGDPKPYYLDGVKYLNVSRREEFEATLTAFTYPIEFAECDGSGRVRPGMLIGQQRRKSFGLSYRTRIGNDLVGADYAYKIHIVYNALASPADRDFRSIGQNVDPSDFSWKITTKPIAFPGYKPTAHVILDSRYIHPVTLSKIEDKLYGTDISSATLPTFAELLSQLDESLNFTLTDNGDGTFLLNGPSDILSVDTFGKFTLTWPNAVDNGDGTITIGS